MPLLSEVPLGDATSHQKKPRIAKIPENNKIKKKFKNFGRD